MVLANLPSILQSVAEAPKVLLVSPSINLFLLRYMDNFHIRNIDGKKIIHSHLPPLNSRAYVKFVNDHLLKKIPGPSHAQIA